MEINGYLFLLTVSYFQLPTSDILLRLRYRYTNG